MCAEAGSGTGAFSRNIDSININTMVQDFICIRFVIAAHSREDTPVDAAEVMHENAAARSSWSKYQGSAMQ